MLVVADCRSWHTAPVPSPPPVLLPPAESSETHGQGRSGPVFHTRGLCLTEEWTSFTTVLRVPRGRGGGGLLGGLLPGFGLERQTVQRGPTRTEVTAILVRQCGVCAWWWVGLQGGGW